MCWLEKAINPNFDLFTVTFTPGVLVYTNLFYFDCCDYLNKYTENRARAAAPSQTMI